MMRYILALAMLLMMPTLSEAFTTTVTGTQVTVTFTEPTTNADTPPTPLQEPNIPAVAPTGGAVITDTVMVPVLAGQEADVIFWATATDLSGNESVNSATSTVRIDRLSPAAPN